MKERDFVTIINNSIQAVGGFSEKIADSPFIPGNPKLRFTKKKPYDNNAVLNGKAFYIEVKWCNGICGFSHKKLSDHQLENLMLIYNNSEGMGNILPVVMYGCYVPRKIKRIYVVHIKYLIENSVSKKQLMNEFPYLNIKKTEYWKLNKKTKQKKLVKEDLFDATRICECIIGLNR